MQKDTKTIVKKVVAPVVILSFFVSQIIKIGMFLEYFIYGCFNSAVTFDEVVIFSFMYENQNMILLPFVFIAIFAAAIILSVMFKKDFTNKKHFWAVLAALPASILVYIFTAVSENLYPLLTIISLGELALFIFIMVIVIKAYLSLFKNKSEEDVDKKEVVSNSK
ncbi:MAG: hypothetical protein R3Y27_08050 [Clostridia bacterium]